MDRDPLMDETLCWCPHCGERFTDRVPAGERTQVLADGRLVRRCLACAVQAQFDAQKGRDT